MGRRWADRWAGRWAHGAHGPWSKVLGTNTRDGKNHTFVVEAVSPKHLQNTDLNL